jgi:hypothetical protein
MLYLYDICKGLEINFERYWESEKEVINPALEQMGFTIDGRWITGEGDSFGPLSRYVHATLGDSEKVTIWYG